MTTRITEVMGDDGETIYIQYDEEDSDELQAVGFIDDIQDRTNKLKRTMKSTVKSYSKLVLDSVKQGLNDNLAPTKVALEFGLQAGGETGIPFVTKGTTQANVKVTIEWDLSQKNPPSS